MNCRKTTKNKNPKVIKIKNGRIMFSSRCLVCNCKNVLKGQEAKELLINLGFNIPLSQIFLLGAFFA